MHRATYSTFSSCSLALEDGQLPLRAVDLAEECRVTSNAVPSGNRVSGLYRDGARPQGGASAPAPGSQGTKAIQNLAPSNMKTGPKLEGVGKAAINPVDPTLAVERGDVQASSRRRRESTPPREPPLPSASSLRAALCPLTHPSGVSLFPSMSTEEQETVSREACAQAEDTIVADSDELGSVDGRTDRDEEDGYASDGFSSASTSIISSVRDYMYENGRRYHRYREGKYNFPNDEVEQSREDMKHAMTRLLCGQKLHFAPIGDCPQEILDLGTGTGIWAIESESTL